MFNSLEFLQTAGPAMAMVVTGAFMALAVCLSVMAVRGR